MNFGDFSNMFAKMKETLKQAFNLKSINEEIKSITQKIMNQIIIMENMN